MTTAVTERRFVCAAALALLVGLAGCRSYESRTREAFDDFQRGHFERAAAAYSDTDTTGSAFLSGVEAGMAALTAGRFEDARDELHRAAAEVRELEDRALLSASGVSESLSSWVLNDTAKSYQGEGFERVYVHACLALAYLALGRLDDVYVEARRSNKLLESEEKLYSKEYRAGGLGHFLSGVVYELLGKPDQAYIDYERMVKKGVGNRLAGRALVRLAGQLGRRDDLERWQSRFGPDVARPAGAASIVVVAGVGTGPFKEEISASIPTPSGLISFAVPTYVRRAQPITGLRLALPRSRTAIWTEEIENVGDVAVENLEDRIALVAAKSVARGVAKRELTQQLQDRYDLVGRIVGDLFSFVSERADLRGWKTLPNSWQACRLFVAPGVHELVLEAPGGESQQLGTFELEPGETMFVVARTVGRALYAHPLGGRRITSASLASERGASTPWP